MSQCVEPWREMLDDDDAKTGRPKGLFQQGEADVI